MNWFKTSQSLVLWHATIPRYAETIAEAGVIKPSGILEQETGMSHQGWSFQEKNFNYQDAIYLSKDKNTAIFYGMQRLRREWEEAEREEGIEPLLTDEDLQFIGLFKINIMPSSLPNLSVNSWDIHGNEYVYLGVITNDNSQDIWFEGPEWIDKTTAAEAEHERLEKIFG